ncbi:hypothetical protein RDV64_19765 [Acuticoccus sp. MNP-M23]|nr:hypothetical protein [Acuticoccus sp. MNP-M23]WMS42276.1 hypothetical protein RDV64_19765 [Acuticoccus sp. MNP-M23]
MEEIDDDDFVRTIDEYDEVRAGSCEEKVIGEGRIDRCARFANMRPAICHSVAPGDDFRLVRARLTIAESVESPLRDLDEAGAGAL